MAMDEGATPAPSLFKRLALNASTWWLMTAIIIVIHGLLLVRYHDAQWMQRGGGLVILCGVMAIARPVIRVGLAALVEKGLPLRGSYLMPAGFDSSNRDRLRPEDRRDLRAVQCHGPVLVALGTLISAYGDLPFKALGYG